MSTNIFTRFFLSKIGIITSTISSILGIALFTPFVFISINIGDYKLIIINSIVLAIQVCCFYVSILRTLKLKRGVLN